MGRVWPGITPMNVWDMRYDMWLLHVKQLPYYESENK